MNTGLFVVVIVVAWSALAVVVALAVGGMAKARDVRAAPGFEPFVNERAPTPAPEEGIRAAM